MIQSSPVPSPVHRFKRAKFWKQVAIGAIVGGVSMGLALASIDGLKGATLTPDEAVALGAGVIYSIIGLFVGLGALFPKAGSELLNVEDEEEIRDQRHIFGWGAVAMLLSGLSMLGLVLGSPGFEFLGRAVAAALVAACVAGIACVGYITRNDSDEFGKRLSRDSGQVTLVLTAALFGGWAVLSHLGYVPMFTALGFLGGGLLIYLVAIFFVVAKAGLIRP